MTTIDRIRRLPAMGFVIAAGIYLHVGVGAHLARAQTQVPGGFAQFGPNHETEPPGFGLPISPIMPNVGIDPVYPGQALPHSRTPTAFFPMVKDSRLTFYSALAADSVAIGGFGRGGFGYGGFGYGGFGYSGIGVSTSLPPTPEFGSGTYRAGNSLPNSTSGMGTGGGNPADPAAAKAGQISTGTAYEDAFDNAANGRPSATRPVRSNRVTLARRPTVRKPTPQPSRKVGARATDAVPSRLGTSSARPEQANSPQEKPSTVKSGETKSPPRRSMLGPLR